MQVQLDQESVVQASSQFWEQMLAMKLVQLPISERFCVQPGHLTGWVLLGGVWRGRIEVRMSAGLAQEATAAMLMQPKESVGIADTLDATKEIANMVAGSIKTALPRPCTMTVPQSEVGDAEYCSLPQTSDSMVVILQHESGEMMVRVYEEEYAA